MVAGEVGLAIDHHVPAVEYATALAPARIELTVSSITSARTGQSERGTTSQAPYRFSRREHATMGVWGGARVEPRTARSCDPRLSPSGNEYERQYVA